MHVAKKPRFTRVPVHALALLFRLLQAPMRFILYITTLCLEMWTGVISFEHSSLFLYNPVYGTTRPSLKHFKPSWPHPLACRKYTVSPTCSNCCRR